MLTVSEVQAVSKEVKKGTETTISCVITGLTAGMKVTWRSSSGEISDEEEEEEDDEPSQEERVSATQQTTEGKQTFTLTLKSDKVTTDTAYTCRVTSTLLPDSGHSDTTVNLNVYGKFREAWTTGINF